MWAWKPWKRVLSVAVGLAGIGYAFVTYNQWRGQQRSSRVDERAWVKYELHGTPTFAVGKAIETQVKFTNIGKTPAKTISGYTMLIIVPEIANPDFSNTGDANNFGTAFIMPNDHFSISAAVTKRSPSGGADAIPLREDQYGDIVMGRSYIAVFGVISYDDIFRIHHTMHF